MLGTVIGIVYEITLELDVETYLGLLDVSFDDSMVARLRAYCVNI